MQGDILEYLVATANLITPVIIAIFGIIGWHLRQTMERRINIEEKLRDDRIEIYNSILEPYIILLMSDAAWSSDNRNKNKNRFDIATKKMLSLDYRKTSFRLSLVGSDPVVNAFNALMQYTFRLAEDQNSNSVKNPGEILSLLGTLLLEIRRSMGNESTKIDNFGMIEWFISDAKQFRNSKA